MHLKMAAIFADDIYKYIFEWKVLYFHSNSIKFVTKGPIANQAALVQVKVWRRTGDKPLPVPMLNQFPDAYMHVYGEMS